MPTLFALIQSPCNKVAATILKDVWIRQDPDCNHFGEGHIPAYLGFQGAYTTDQCATPAVRGRHKIEPFTVGATENNHAQ